MLTSPGGESVFAMELKHSQSIITLSPPCSHLAFFRMGRPGKRT